MPHKRVIVALDFDEELMAIQFIDRIKPESCRLKVGKELFVTAGPQFVEKLINKGYDVFLDLKFHDIPTTVAKACKAAAKLGVWMVNVHALGGKAMLMAAREGLDFSLTKKPLLTAVTVLTSLSSEDLNAVGITQSAEEEVVKLASLAKECALDGVVCSAKEVATLRTQLGPEFLLVTPGIRPQGSSADDQQRILTPDQALMQGANYLVIGRPITQAKNPLEALININHSISTFITGQQ